MTSQNEGREIPLSEARRLALEASERAEKRRKEGIYSLLPVATGLHIEALESRIAELERERDDYQKAVKMFQAEVVPLRAKLERALKVVEAARKHCASRDASDEKLVKALDAFDKGGDLTDPEEGT